MLTITYKSELKFQSVTLKAAKIWNAALSGLVQFIPSESPKLRIWTGALDTVAHPGRVAQHDNIGKGNHVITMGSHVKWSLNPLHRFIGTGEDALNAIVHEMGHVIGLPHAFERDYIMHPDIPGGMRLPMLSKEEKQTYRNFLRNL